MWGLGGGGGSGGAGWVGVGSLHGAAYVAWELPPPVAHEQLTPLTAHGVSNACKV